VPDEDAICRADDAARRKLPRCRRNLLARALFAAAPLLVFPITTRAYDLHFDYTSFETGFGQAQFNILNYPSINGNYMMTSTDNHRPAMVANGNNLAEFYNWLQQRYGAHATKNGNISADEIDAYVVSNSAKNGPKPNWLVLNEISASLWSANAGPPSDSTYRTWLIDCVTRLHDHYGYNVVTLAPFQNPGANDASWQALAEVSYVGIECYLSGSEVWNSGSNDAQRLSWAQSQYQASKNSYLNRGVPESKLFVTEHFANNNATYTDGQGNVLTTGWGRAGLASAADWDSVIQIRQDAILNVGFDGFLAYNWGGNAMGVTQAEQIQHEYYYRSRRVLHSQQPQWLSNSAISINGTAIPLSWSQPLNWVGGVPNASGAVANFWRTLTANRSLTLDGDKTLGTITFDSPYSYTIGPGAAGSLVLSNSGSAATLISNQGDHFIEASVQLKSNLNAAINEGTFTISGIVFGAGGLIKSGAGTLALNGVNSYAGDTTVAAGALRIGADSLANATNVFLSTGAMLELKFTGSPEIIESLFFNGVSQAVGIWGAVGSGAQFTSQFLAGTGSLLVTTFVPPLLLGDYNSDGVVDAADYVTWRGNLGEASIANRDPGNMGVVGQADYNSWRSHFGQSAAGLGANFHAAAPEPPAWVLVLLETLGISSRLRRRRS